MGRSRSLLTLCLAVAIVAGAPPPARAADKPHATYRAGEVIVKYRARARMAERASARALVHARPLRSFEFIGAELVHVDGMDVPEAIARLKADPMVEYAEPNYELHALVTPNDPQFPQMYALHNTGQTGGTPGADIRAPEAWDLFTGSDIMVGVIDTGVDYTHPDLAPNIWTNPGEIAGNGIDDDHNGYVDDIHGYDFVNNDGDPMDDHGHGTHVSGTIAAVGNNGVGVVGVNWHARIVGIKFLNAGGSGTTDAAISAVQYAIRVGVRLTSNSWGGGAFSQALLDAINASGAAGQVFVAAAGNSSMNIDVTPSYPVGYDSPYILGVAATDHNDALASFSNWGPGHVQLAAPGVAILSTLPGASYGLLSGTSMATPHVSGALAFVLGRFPSMTGLLARDLLLQGVDPVAGLNGIVSTGGRLNLLTPVLEPDSLRPAPITDLAVVDRSSNSLLLSWTATGDDSLTGRAVRYDIRYSTAPITAANFGSASPATGPSPRPAGARDSAEVLGLGFNTTYYVAVKALDEFANAGAISNVANGTTLGVPDITALPTSFFQELLTGASATQTLTLRNDGEGTLDWTAPLPELVFAQQTPYPYLALAKGEQDPRPGTPVVAGAGGPDPFGYRWVDSDEAGGPPFAWVDISGVGNLVPISGDDQTSVPIPMGMEFPFYGNVFSSLRVSTNGFISFTDASASFSNQPLPNSGAPANMIAAMWDDLFVGGAGVYTYFDGSRFIISWQAVDHFGGGGPYTFQILLYPSGDIRMQYLQLGDPKNSATVGMQNADRSLGLTAAFNTNYLHDGLAVRFSKGPNWLTIAPRSGRIAAGQSVDLRLSFDAVEVLGGDYQARVRIASNDPDEGVVVLPVAMRVIGAPDMLLQGAERQITSTMPYTTDGASTSHTLAVVDPPAADGRFDLTADGDYGDVAETATLTVEGTSIGQVGGSGADCQAVSGSFPVSQAALAGMVADGEVHALVQNSAFVNPFCTLNRHTVRLRYRLGADSLLFGEVFVAGCRAETLVVRNRGTDSLRITGVGLTGAGFTVSPTSFVVAVGQAVPMVVTFCPTAIGDRTGTITIHGNDPDNPSQDVALVGRGVIAPDIGVTPASLAADLLSGETLTQVVHIANTGGSDLHFDATPSTTAPAAVTLSPRPAAWVQAAGDDPGSRRAPAGYVASTPSRRAAASTGTPALLIMDQLPWGTDADQAVLNANGIPYDLIPSSELAATDLSRYHVVIVASDQPNTTYGRLVAAAGQIDRYVASGGTLEFHGAGWGWNGGDPSAVPLPGGARVTFRLADVNRVLIPTHPVAAGVPDPFTGTSASHSVVVSAPAGAAIVMTEAGGSPTLVEYHHGLGTVLIACQTLEFGLASGQTAGLVLQNLIPYAYNHTPQWLSLDPPNGTVPAGGTLDLTVHIDAASLFGGTYPGEVRIASNDPDEALVSVPVTLRVTGVPDIDVTPTAIAFDTVFIGVTRHDSLRVNNFGTDSLRVTGISSDDGDYGVDGGAFVLGPGGGRTVPVSFHPSRAGAIDATLRVTSDDPDEGTVAVALHGHGLVPPVFGVTPDSLSADLLSGQTATRTLTVSNTGGSPLNVEVSSVGRVMAAVERHPQRYERGPDPREAPPWTPTEPTLNQTRRSTGPVVMAGEYSGTYLHFGITDFGEIMPFQYPIGNEHLAVGAFDAGYTVAYQFHGSDNVAYAGYQDRSGIIPVSYRVIADSPVTLIAEAVTRTQDGLLEITRTFSFPKADKGVRIETRLRDLSGEGLQNLAFKEWADWDVDGRFDDTWDYDRERNMVHAQATHITAVAGASTPFAMDANGWNDFNRRATTIDVPAGPIVLDGLALLHYELGDLAPAGTQSVTAAYGAADNLAELQAVVDRLIANGGWLSVDPARFTVPAGSSLALRVTFDPGELLGGDYDAFIRLESNDPFRSLAQVPAHLHVTGVPNISVGGAQVTLESVRPYVESGALTLHSLRVDTPPAGAGTVELLAEGDYGDFSEQAVLTVEGRLLGQVGGVAVDCDPAHALFSLDAATMAALAADGVIDARVQNTANVDVFCPLNRHTVRVSYRMRSDTLEFGRLFIGDVRELGVSVRNSGSDDLVLSAATVEGTGYSVTGPSLPRTLPPGAEVAFQVRFAPTGPCTPCTGTLRFTSNDPDQGTVEVALDGSAVPPPDIAVSPTSIVSNLVVPARETRTLTIANTGLSELFFSVSPAAPDSGPVPAGSLQGPDAVVSTGDPTSHGMRPGEHFKGPLVPVLRRPHVQSGSVLVIADSGTEGDVSAVLGAAGYGVTQVVDDAIWNGTNPSPDGFAAVVLLDGVDYGDNMPTAGQLALVDFVNHGGGLIFTEWIAYEVQTGFYGSMLPLIPLTRTNGTSGSFLFQVVQSHPVTAGVTPSFFASGGLSTGFANSGTPVVIRSLDGSPTVIVKDVGQGHVVEFAIAGNYGGDRPFANPDVQRLLVNAADWVTGGTWLSVSPAAGTVPAGGHIDLSVLIDSEGLRPGVYRDSIRVASNDPDERDVAIPVTLNASVVPDIDPSPALVDFGTLFVGQASTLSLQLRNPGLAELEVTSGTLTGAAYSMIGVSFPIVVPPSSQRAVTIRFSPTTTCAPCLGSISFASNDPDENPLVVGLTGVSVLPPDIDLRPTAVADTVTIPNVHSKPVLVRNIGSSPLYVSFETLAVAESLKAVPSWLSVAPSADTLEVNESRNFEITFTTAGLLGGSYAAKVRVTSNDPDESTLDVPITLLAVGVPDIAASPSPLSFGTVFTNYTRDLTLTLANPGTDTLRVTSGTPGSAAYQMIGASFPIKVAPHGATDVTVRFAPTAACDPCSTGLVLRSNAAGHDPFAAPLTGRGLIPPDAGYQPGLLRAAGATTLGPGPMVRTQTLRIDNTGGSPLEFSTAAISTADSVTVYDGFEPPKQPGMPDPVDPRPGILGNGGPDHFGYRWRDSDAPNGPHFDWIDITTTGTRLSMTGDDLFSPNIPLGFAFKYYGLDFRFVNVCTNGFISFSSTSVQHTNQPLPSTAAPFTMLAPWWDDLDFGAVQRAWVKRDPGRFVVTWDAVPRHGGAGPYTFQTILYSSGRIVFQYLTMAAPLNSATIGIQNNLRTDGLTVVFNQPYMHDSLAVELFSTPRWLTATPGSGVIPAGGSADLEVRFDSDQLPDGDYTGTVALYTNDPDETTLNVAANLHVGVVTAALNVDPNALNRNSNANWVSSNIELPSGFDPNTLGLGSMRLQRSLPMAVGAPYEIVDSDGDGVPELRCKFDRVQLMALLEDGPAVPVEAIGEIPGVSWFQALDVVRVMRPGVQDPPTAERIYEAGSRVLLEWLPTPDTAVHYDLWFSANAGESWSLSASGLIGTSCTWTVPGQPTSQGRLELVAMDAQGVRGSWLSGDLRIQMGTSDVGRKLPTELGLRNLGENPAHGAVHLELALPERAVVDLAVYDVHGALVRRLASGPIEPGWRTIVWDGRSETGRPSAAGVYFLRLTAGGKRLTQRLALVH